MLFSVSLLPGLLPPGSKSFLWVLLDSLSLLSQICPSVFCPHPHSGSTPAVCPLLTESWGEASGGGGGVSPNILSGFPRSPPVPAASGGQQAQKLTPQPSFSPFAHYSSQVRHVQHRHCPLSSRLKCPGGPALLTDLPEQSPDSQPARDILPPFMESLRKAALTPFWILPFPSLPPHPPLRPRSPVP